MKKIDIVNTMQVGLTRKTAETLGCLDIWEKNKGDDIGIQITTPDLAEEIINEYWKSFRDIARSDEIVQSVNDLPYSRARIKYAHLFYVETLIANSLFNKKIGDQLLDSYADINRRFVEEAETINKDWREYRDIVSKKGLADNPMGNIFKRALNDEIEFNNFLAEFSKLMQKTIPGVTKKKIKK